MAGENNLQSVDERITFEQIIAGALLKLEKLDNIDISLILEDFTRTTEKEVDIYFPIEYLNKYFYFDQWGNISVNPKTPLDYFIQEKKCTVREKFIEIAKSTVIEYFNQFDAEEFKQRKERYMQEKKLVLFGANILLISDDEEDYIQLERYGFKNIDYFKSIIRADEYFEKNPDALKKYHIILNGNQSVKDIGLSSYVKLASEIINLNCQHHVLVSSLNKYNYRDLLQFTTYLTDKINHRSWVVKENSYFSLFDRIVECAIINHLSDVVSLEKTNYTPIEDYINPDRIPLPTKKSDLKILCLGNMEFKEYIQEVANELGLNINFKFDDNLALLEHVIKHLGDYDIIIASNLYSSKLLRMSSEVTEQCKDTGRDLSLLVTYSTDSINLGDRVNLSYVFGGSLSNDQKDQYLSFKVSDDQNGHLKKNHVLAIIEQGVQLYNNGLLQYSGKPIDDLDFKMADQYDEEYNQRQEINVQRDRENLILVSKFECIISTVLRYLEFRRLGLILEDIDGLRITETDDGICLENICGDRTLCSITFPRRNTQRNLRMFSIRTLTNKGKLGNPEVVGLYTSNFKKLEGIPRYPDETQIKSILATEKKVKALIDPLINEVCTPKCDSKKKVLKDKK